MSGSGIALFALLVALASAAAGAAARFLRIPYTIALVLAGLCIGILHRPPPFFIPSIVLAVFLPPLLFAAAWEIDLRLLRRRWLPIALLATIGVGIGVAVTYAVLATGAGIAGAIALTFGAIIGATDPVAVIALFRELAVDRDLTTIVEGESLFNDGVAVVLVRSLSAGVVAGATTITVDPSSVAVQAVILTAGGALIGAIFGFIAAHAVRGIARWYVAIALTGIAAYGAYAAAEWAHVSGIVAVIAAGLTCAQARGTSGWPSSSTAAADRFWERAAFFANSILFVMVGFAVDLRSLAPFAEACAWAVGAVIVARAATVYGVCSVIRITGFRIASRSQQVLALGGLRGALSLALAVGLPERFPDRSALIAMVYAVVLFTLVAQGLCLRPAITALGLQEREAAGSLQN